ncbi:hypothetical protein BIW11_00199 [Tropilaelaps mercedesae]|uniref:Uncharacterized protein n=1 Tax=Tropilaelaps mercedesae TaxID=418985 RepID=A0A1V9Y056_9ACAR|nr:hypothetical protein BIW11_00199 [Tropilaelaps mercedesae]
MPTYVIGLASSVMEWPPRPYDAPCGLSSRVLLPTNSDSRRSEHINSCPDRVRHQQWLTRMHLFAASGQMAPRVNMLTSIDHQSSEKKTMVEKSIVGVEGEIRE